ncbi:hypothetical protein DESC_460149 [Desulfosarcina cetonica]|nr:hypothetical protein DESC_460149 [Desulfosarcina cetonica]
MRKPEMALGTFYFMIPTNKPVPNFTTLPIWHITHRCHKRKFLLKYVQRSSSMVAVAT